MTTHDDHIELPMSQIEINQISACAGKQSTVPSKATVKRSGRLKKNEKDAAVKAALIMQVALGIRLGWHSPKSVDK
jgi:hypothetical protein